MPGTIRAFFLFQSLIEPFEELSLPCYTILRVKHPMVLIWQIQQFRVKAVQLSRLKSFQPLLYGHTIIYSTLYDHYRRVPFIDKVAWVITFVAQWLWLFPVCAAKVPVGKPYLFCSAIPRFKIKKAIMGNESFETVVVHARQHINTIATITCAHAP